MNTHTKVDQIDLWPENCGTLMSESHKEEERDIVILDWEV